MFESNMSQGQIKTRQGKHASKNGHEVELVQDFELNFPVFKTFSEHRAKLSSYLWLFITYLLFATGWHILYFEENHTIFASTFFLG